MPVLHAAFFTALILIAGMAILYSVLSLQGPGIERMSVHAWIAMGLGAGLTLAVSIGLFALTFYSSRSGHDDAIDRTGAENPTIGPDQSPRI